jgi:hypothetical protein
MSTFTHADCTTSERCAADPGGFFHRLNTDCGAGANAFGMGSASLNGLRISGLVGNTSMYTASANT